MIHLQTLRLRRHLTQADLALLSGVPQHAISRLESGPTGKPSIKTALALAKALKVDVASLEFGNMPKMTPGRKGPRPDQRKRYKAARQARKAAAA